MSETWTSEEYQRYLETGEAPPGATIVNPVTTAQTSACDVVCTELEQGKEKDPKRQIRGRNTQRDGKSFEADIVAANTEYEREGMARIEQLPVATQPMPKTWMSREHAKKAGIARILSERAPFDFYGTIGLMGARPFSTRGRAIAMECKATLEHKTRLPMGKKSTLKAHQVHACADAWRNYGTISVIVWRNGRERGALMPDRILDASQMLRIGSRKSIPWDWFMPYPLRSINGGRIIEHWLEPVISFINMNLEHHDEQARKRST